MKANPQAAARLHDLGMVFKELSSRTPWKSRGIGRFLSVILAFCAQAGQKEG